MADETKNEQQPGTDLAKEQDKVAEANATAHEDKVEKAEEPHLTAHSSLKSLLDRLREKVDKSNEAKSQYSQSVREQLRARFELRDLNDETQLEGISDAVQMVQELVDEKVATLDQIIRKGEECPCPKHRGLAMIASSLKNGWIGVA